MTIAAGIRLQGAHSAHGTRSLPLAGTPAAATARPSSSSAPATGGRSISRRGAKSVATEASAADSVGEVSHDDPGSRQTPPGRKHLIVVAHILERNLVANEEFVRHAQLVPPLLICAVVFQHQIGDIYA